MVPSQRLQGLIRGMQRARAVVEQAYRVVEEARQDAHNDGAAPVLSDQRLRALFEHSGDLVAILDVMGAYRYASPSYQRLLGYAPEELLGTSAFDLLHPDDVAGAFAIFKEGITERNALRTTDVRVRHADGSWRTLEVIGNNRLFDPAVRGVIINARDITERKQTEEERAHLLAREREARAAAEAAVQVRDHILSAVSHDLKNPLTSIKGHTQLLRRRLDKLDLPDHERWVTPLTAIDEAATRMTRMINDLVDVARLHAGQPLDLDRRPTDLVALTRQIAREHEHAADGRRIHVETDLPELVGDYDTFRLERVLSNLLTNALKYSPPDRDVTITVSQEDHKWAVVEVQDQGMGIPASDLPHVFTWYHRASNVKHLGGTGIGLASARQIVEQHGGTVSVASEEGAGTTVTVRLPLVAPPAGE